MYINLFEKPKLIVDTINGIGIKLRIRAALKDGSYVISLRKLSYASVIIGYLVQVILLILIYNQNLNLLNDQLNNNKYKRHP